MNKSESNSNLVKILNDPFSNMGKQFSAIETAKSSTFFLCLGSTMTSDIEGISAAGATAEDRRLTPRFDAEALILGKTADGSSIPVSPQGIASPVVLTRACLNIVDSKKVVVDCGTFSPPRVESVKLGTMPAQCVSSGNALPFEHIQDLFERGMRLGAEAAKCSDIVVVGECVPAGTTTALAVLKGLGKEVDSYVSSSIPQPSGAQRMSLVNEGLEKCGLKTVVDTGLERDPFMVLSALGDPMQPVAAGIAIGASKSSTVVLAGGSQMITVYKVAKDISAKLDASILSNLENNVLVITTKWVVNDKSADTPTLAKALNVPIAYSAFSLKDSSHEGLRSYENGHVKEGVGAGASCAIAHLVSKYSQPEILQAVDNSYEELVTKNK